MKTQRGSAELPVAIAGGYWTGASAVVDLLAEHSDVAVLPGEFTLFSFGQFFQEVTSPLLRGQALGAEAERCLWRFTRFNSPDTFRPLRRVFRRALAPLGIYPPALSVAQTNMAALAGPEYATGCRDLLRAIRAGRAADLSRLVSHVLAAAARGVHRSSSPWRVHAFDQLVAPPYIDDALRMLPDLRLIMIDRDWRDQYISMRRPYLRMASVNQRLGVRPWDEPAEMAPRAVAEFFVRLRRRMVAERERLARDHGGRTLWLSFEALVGAPASSVPRILDFLNLDQSRWTPGVRFHPDVSLRRTGKWRWHRDRRSPVWSEILELMPLLGEPSEVE